MYSARHADLPRKTDYIFHTAGSLLQKRTGVRGYGGSPLLQAETEVGVFQPITAVRF